MSYIWSTIAKRIITSVAMLIMASIIVFVGTEVLPGDALEVSIPPDELRFFSDDELAAMRAELGLDRPPIERYLTWLAGAARFDFGVTVLNREPVFEGLRAPLMNTLVMASVGMLLLPGLAVLMGTLAALKPGGRLDNTISTIALVGYSVPEFVLGNLFILVFAVWLGLQPAVITLPTKTTVEALIAVLPLPIVTLVFGAVAYQFRLMRNSMAEALQSPFVERARLAGIASWRVVVLHALPMALIPVLAAAAQFAAGLLSGVLVLDVVFNYPGLGRHVVDTIATRDVGSIQAIAFLAALGVITTSLLADIAILFIDPRTRQ